MLFRRRKRERIAIRAGNAGQRLGAGVHVSLSLPDSKIPAFQGVAWDYDTLGGLRYTPHGWLQSEDAPQQPSQARVPETIAPWKQRPIIGNHWVEVYYRTPPDNLVTDASAHTGYPRVSITDGHYAKFMPPPVSLPVLHASRNEIPYKVPPVQDRGKPYWADYHPTPYTPWTGA